MNAINAGIILSALGGLAFLGCSDKSTSTTEPFLEQTVFQYSPADGSTDIRLDANVGLWFANPVDRALVERSFQLISEADMADSNCVISTTMNHGSMLDAMADSSMMHHMDQYHSTRGTFVWNTDSTLCTFRPDSLMSPKTQYMIHLGREMTLMLRFRTGSMAMMAGHGAGAMVDDMMFHFATLDTAQQGGGHLGHH